MTEQVKPTPGPYTMNPEGTGFYASKVAPYIAIAPLGRPDAERQANAALCFDAFTVRHETGLTPRQLQEQRDALDFYSSNQALELAELKEQRSELLAEMERYRVIIDRAEQEQGTWARLAEGTGIATANGYRAAIAKARGGSDA